MEQENICLLEYFDKFKEYKNFSKLREKLASVSEIRYLKDIQIGELTMPQIGPSPEISKFHKLIEKEWGEKEAIEIKYMLKFYDGKEIENIEEAIIILDIKHLESNNENYLIIKNKLLNKETLQDSDLDFLMEKKDIISVNLTFFLLNI